MHDFQADLDKIGQISAVPLILDVVCRVTHMRFAAIARVTDDRWVACQVRDDIEFGLKRGGELDVETTICKEVRDASRAVVIDHVALDEAYCEHPTPRLYGFQSYISQPIILPDGSFFGTLCAIDPEPAKLNTPEVVGMFKLFADLIAFHLTTVDRLTATEAMLLNERQAAELREQFIAVLGHDLRNPLSSISAGVRRITTLKPADQDRMVRLIDNSIARMAGLIDNVLDFARSRLGGGLSLDRKPNQNLGPKLQQVIDELREAWPGREIRSDLILPLRVNCDSDRLAQMLSNLIANALLHGSQTDPVLVVARADANILSIAVTNSGDPIPASAQDGLFEPFTRARVRPHQQGLGLGLFIAQEIARAHGGVLEVDSSQEQTVFLYRMAMLALD
ncbi:GAF domain-containing sensor histidine kinase [Alsobacter sp. SYSU BS001988]